VTLPARSAGSYLLPEPVWQAVRTAFAGEVARRIPRLQAAAEALHSAGGAGVPAAALEEVLRDVHTLGSSAAVVGEDTASALARNCEAVLRTWLVDAEGQLVGVLPAEVAKPLAEQIEDLGRELHAWVPGPNPVSGEAVGSA